MWKGFTGALLFTEIMLMKSGVSGRVSSITDSMGDVSCYEAKHTSAV